MQKWTNSGTVKFERGVWDMSTALQLEDWLEPAAPLDDPGNGRTDALLVASAFLPVLMLRESLGLNQLVAWGGVVRARCCTCSLRGTHYISVTYLRWCERPE